MSFSAPLRQFVPSDERRVTRRARQHSLLWSAIPLALATAAVGLFELGHPSLSLDESKHVGVAQLPLSEMPFTFSNPGGASHAFYELLLHLWQFGGTSETFLRSLSVALGVGTVLALFALNARLFDRRTAVASCTLLIVNLFFIRYMQEAGAYVLAVFLVVTASWCFTAAIDRPSTRRWSTYAVVSAAAVWAHAFAGFVVLGHAVSLLVRRPRPMFRGVGASYVIAAVLTSPLMLSMWSAERTEPGTWRSTAAFEPFVYLTGAGSVPTRVANLLALVYFAICCIGVIVMVRAENRHRHRAAGPWANSLVLLWVGVPLLATVSLSLAGTVPDPRSLIVVLPAFITVAGIGISRVQRRMLRDLVLAAVVALSTVPLVPYYRTTIREGGDWRAATAYVAEHTHSGDGVVFVSRYGRGLFEYYAPRFNAYKDLSPLYPAQPWSTVARVFGSAHSEPSERAVDRLRGVSRVWTFLGWGEFDSTAEDSAAVWRVLHEEYTLVTSRDFGPGLEVRLYEPNGAASK